MTAKNGQVFQAAGSVITGDVTIGRDCGVWYNAVIRGDEVDIHIGDRTNIQDNAVVHGDPGNPVWIGSGVTIGHGAIVHGCSIGDNSLIGMGAILLNGARIGRDCIIGAGALVNGNPGRIRRFRQSRQDPGTDEPGSRGGEPPQRGCLCRTGKKKQGAAVKGRSLFRYAPRHILFYHTICKSLPFPAKQAGGRQFTYGRSGG